MTEHGVEIYESKIQPLVGKVMFTVFSNRKSMILLDSLEARQTTNADCYIMMVDISRFRPEKTAFSLQYNKTRPHTNLRTMNHISNFAWTLLSHLLLTFICLGHLKKDYFLSVVYVYLVPHSTLPCPQLALMSHPRITNLLLPSPCS